MPDDADFLCGGWIWDAAMRELRFHERTRKGWKEEPEQAEQLKPVKAVVWHRWSQAPMQTATGAMMPPSLSRVVVQFEAGGDISLNENDRACAEKLARAIAETYGVAVVEEGAPGGRRGGNLPERDSMGRYVTSTGKAEITLDETAREITETRPRFPFGRKRRTVSFAEVRRLALALEVKGPLETFTLWGEVGVEGERIPLAAYEGYEGWADPEEWRGFAREVARTIGVELGGA